MMYVLKYGIVNQDEYLSASQERIFTNKRKAMAAVRGLLKSLPAEWKEVTDHDHNLLAFEAEEVTFRQRTGNITFQDLTGEGYITLYAAPPETEAAWEDLPPFECF